MFHPLTDYQLFNDVHFFHMPDEELETDGKQVQYNGTDLLSKYIGSKVA